jgi:hypothetical protein
MEIFKIPLHSVIDIITNSSTEIFTYSEGSVEPCREVLTEVLKLMGEDTPIDEMFELAVEPDMDRFETYLQYELNYDNPDLEEIIKEKYDLSSFNEDISVLRKIYEEFEEDFEQGEYFELPTNLVIKPKDEKFNALAEKLINFLYSTDAVEHYDG